MSLVVSIAVFDSLRFAIFFVLMSTFLVSFQFLRGAGSATRLEIFVLVVQIVFFMAFAFLYFGTRILSVLEQLVLIR